MKKNEKGLEEEIKPEKSGKPKKKTKRKKAVLILLTITVLLLLVCVVVGFCGYVWVNDEYGSTLLPGTTVNDIDCSSMSVTQARSLIAKKVEDYKITVRFQDGEKETIQAADIDFAYKEDGSLTEIKNSQDPFTWLKDGKPAQKYKISEAFTFDETKLRDKLMSMPCMKEENMVKPENAYMTFQDGQFVVIDEVYGSEIDTEAVYKALVEAVKDRKETLSVKDLDVYSKPTVFKDDKGLNETAAAYNTYLQTDVTYTIGDAEVTVNGDAIIDWFTVDDAGNYSRDDDVFLTNVYNIVDQMAADYDTLGAPIVFDTTSGREVTEYSGVYGWQIDTGTEYDALMTAVNEGQQWVRDPEYSCTANTHAGNTIGNTYIEVDLEKQHMYYYRDGSVIFESDFVSGLASDPKKATPVGVYLLYYKQLDHIMIGENNEYRTPCKYWMPFNGGVGFHDAIWQPKFGGDWYKDEEGGSHGCINLPLEAAAELYDIIQTDVPIIVFN